MVTLREGSPRDSDQFCRNVQNKVVKKKRETLKESD